MSGASDFENQVAEGLSVDVDGWDFSWFDGHATEERTSWHYAEMAAARLKAVAASLDIETGGGEVYSWALARAASLAGRVPATIAATESWPPNFRIAQRNLEAFGGVVLELENEAPLPYEDRMFALVMSRHPEFTPWAEIARVLAPGGTFLSQQIVHGTNRDLYEFMMGPQWVDPVSALDHLREGAEAVGLSVVDVREEWPVLEFFDLVSVIVFLRKVIWTVPDFSVEKYRDRLVAMHEHIAQLGSFVSRGGRALIEAARAE